LRIRVATAADLPALAVVMDAAIEELQRDVITPGQIAASRAIMGIDTQLVEDGTYFVVELDGALAGCGGWSRRATLYGSDATPGRDARLLDPATEPARVRAMYTHPSFARRGVGRLVLSTCEDAARAEGFRELELMATQSGRRLYAAYGFEAVEDLTDDRGGEPVPLTRMRKVVT
jgi:GNAT superfamily N-acetyltransferase